MTTLKTDRELLQDALQDVEDFKAELAKVQAERDKLKENFEDCHADLGKVQAELETARLQRDSHKAQHLERDDACKRVKSQMDHWYEVADIRLREWKKAEAERDAAVAQVAALVEVTRRAMRLACTCLAGGEECDTCRPIYKALANVPAAATALLAERDGLREFKQRVTSACGEACICRKVTEPPCWYCLLVGKQTVVTCCACESPATCLGAYEGNEEDEPSCDKHCGHGNEDGHCVPVTQTGISV